MFSKVWEGKLDGLDRNNLAETLYQDSLPPPYGGGKRTPKNRIGKDQALEVAEVMVSQLPCLSGQAMVHIAKESREYFVISEGNSGLRGRFISSRQSEVMPAGI